MPQVRLPRVRVDAIHEVHLVLGQELERAARYIPSVRSVRVGRRVLHGPGYERDMSVGFPFAAIFEFDDLADLQAYLAHPAHEDLGARFSDSLASALVCDFEMDSVEGVRDWFSR